MTTEHMIYLFLCGIAICILLFAQQSYIEANDAFNETDRKFMKDFDDCKRMIKQHPQDADAIIDGFEDRWNKYIESWRMKEYVGKLIESQYRSLYNLN